MTDGPTIELPPGIPRPGDLIAGGKYSIEAALAAGGMGIVFSAMHLQLGARVAIKFLHPDATRVPEAVPRFLTEARAAARISSEHVVRILDVDMLETGTPYIVMEYLAGEDLSDLLAARGPLPLPEALDLFLQACEGVAEAHARGIVHRDLKPPNLFVTRRSEGSALVKVLDFGLVKATDPRDSESKNLTKATTVMGTPQYMSPEQIRSSRDVDVRTDIWSLGVILYEMLAGAPPFDGETSTAICAAVVADVPPPLASRRPGISDGLEAILVHCLAKDPRHRFGSIAELADALAPYSPRRTSRLSVERILQLAGLEEREDSEPMRAAAVRAAHASAKTMQSAERIETGGRRLRVLAALGTFLAVALVLWIWSRGGRQTDASPRPRTTAPAAQTAVAAPVTAAPVTAAPETSAPIAEEATAAPSGRHRRTKRDKTGDLEIRLER